MLITYRSQSDRRLLNRADPAYWHPAYGRLLEEVAYPLARLGDFITHITYGPIIVGRKLPTASGQPALALVNQGQLGDAGVDLRGAALIPPGCDWDRPSARVQHGDLLIARSGVGSLGKNRLAVFFEDCPAVVGSFVDLVRLEGLDPVYVALFLKTRYGWGQIHRLINGVAVPNVSFEEIRQLRIAVAPEALQQELRGTYLQAILPLHDDHDPRATESHRALVARTEGLLQSRP
ncbi:MAG: hypothetical protein ABFD94_09520 [Armatimonadia bacterium]